MTRIRILIVLLGVYALAAGCSSDPETPLGAEFVDGGLIGSEPGEVFQETLLVSSGDTSFVVNAVLSKNTEVVRGGAQFRDVLFFGRKDDFEMAMIFRVDFSTAGGDTAKTVIMAELGLRSPFKNDTSSAGGHFIELATPYSEGDTLLSLPLTTDTIADGTGTITKRVVRALPLWTYSLPPQLVQDWIRGLKPHNGFAVVVDDPSTSVRVINSMKEAVPPPEEALRPFLQVFFENGDKRAYFMAADATFVKALTSTTDLLMSDGVISRVFLPIDLTQVPSKVLLHDAKLVLQSVEKASTGMTVSLYAPTTPIVGDDGVFAGTLVAVKTMKEGTSTLQLPIRAILERFIASGDSLKALVLRYSPESVEPRRVEFHTSSAPDSLKPRIQMTFSEAPKFPRP